MINFFNHIKTSIKIKLMFFYWKYRNFDEGLKIFDSNLSPTTKLGKKTMVRSGNEVGNISLGDYSYISGPRSYVEEAVIGKFCSIARQVIIGVSGHNYEWVTTSPIITSNEYGFIKDNVLEPQKGMPVIGNDVWIGLNAIIMRGVVIGDGAVVAAGSIVTKDVDSYSIVAGTPAKHIRYRFSVDQRQKLLDIKWWEWEEIKIKENVDLFYDIDAFISKHYIH
jgi:acetyltransferase-like isoleucine patch superfamily enzyme